MTAHVVLRILNWEQVEGMAKTVNDFICFDTPQVLRNFTQQERWIFLMLVCSSFPRSEEELEVNITQFCGLFSEVQKVVFEGVVTKAIKSGLMKVSYMKYETDKHQEAFIEE